MHLVKLGGVVKDNDVGIVAELYEEEDKLVLGTQVTAELGDPQHDSLGAMIPSFEDQEE